MKQFLSLIALFSLATSASFAKDVRSSLNCQSGDLSHGAEIGAITSVEVQAQYVMNYAIKNPVVTVESTNYNDDVVTDVGRKDMLEKDANYKPRKYINYDRYSLSQLTNTADFGAFNPGDYCEIQLLLPKNVLELNEFDAPAIINCDQSGGSITLTCTLK